MLRRKVQSEMPVDQEWIPAFAGMTSTAFERKREPTCKPGSVEGSHSSATYVTARL